MIKLRAVCLLTNGGIGKMDRAFEIVLGSEQTSWLLCARGTATVVWHAKNVANGVENSVDVAHGVDATAATAAAGGRWGRGERWMLFAGFRAQSGDMSVRHRFMSAAQTAFECASKHWRRGRVARSARIKIAYNIVISK